MKKYFISYFQNETNILENFKNTFDNYNNAKSYILNDMKTITINDNTFTILQIIDKKPTEFHIDGYYLVSNETKTKFDIYLKKTIIRKGYIYNSVENVIDYVGFFQINSININEQSHQYEYSNFIIKSNSTPSSFNVQPKIKEDFIQELKTKISERKNIKLKIN